MWDSPVSRVLLDAWRTTKERDERLSHDRHFHDQRRLCSHNTQHTTHFPSHPCYRLGLGQITCDRLSKKTRVVKSEYFQVSSKSNKKITKPQNIHHLQMVNSIRIYYNSCILQNVCILQYVGGCLSFVSVFCWSSFFSINKRLRKLSIWEEFVTWQLLLDNGN